MYLYILPHFLYSSYGPPGAIQLAKSGARKEEHADSVQVQTSDNAARELIGIAKNRLHKAWLDLRNLF